MFHGILEADLLKSAENLRNIEEGDSGAGRQREVVRLLPAGVCERDLVQFAVLVDSAVALKIKKTFTPVLIMILNFPPKKLNGYQIPGNAMTSLAVYKSRLNRSDHVCSAQITSSYQVLVGVHTAKMTELTLTFSENFMEETNNALESSRFKDVKIILSGEVKHSVNGTYG